MTIVLMLRRDTGFGAMARQRGCSKRVFLRTEMYMHIIITRVEMLQIDITSPFNYTLPLTLRPPSATAGVEADLSPLNEDEFR